MKQKHHAVHLSFILGIFLSLLFTFHGSAQTVHISPTGDGGFETGTTLAANGWTVNTPALSTMTQWVCSTGASGYTGARCAYVSNDASIVPPPNSYDNVIRVSHLYRNVTIPASNPQIQLSFSWQCRGESSFDRMRVWLVPTTFNPDNTNQIGGVGTAPTGRVAVGASHYSASTNWMNEVITIPAEYAGTTFRLVFEWRNDGSINNNPPIAIDNISLTSQALSAYCTAGGTNNSRYINNFSTSGAITNITNPSTYSAGGYGNFTSQAVVAAPASTVNFSSNFAGGTFGFKIWVDWNSNFIFEAGETMYTSPGFQSSITGTITVPAATPAGNYRMRIRANWNESEPVACGSTGTGEVEDYTFTVQPLPCPTVPGSPSVTAITTTSANFSWVAASPAPAAGYTYYYSTSSTSPAFASTGSGNTTSTSILLSPLLSGTQYYAWVRSNCGGANNMGTWIGPITFTTSISNNECAGAITAPVNSTTACTNTISGTSVGATQSIAGCVGIADDDVWYKFVATSTAHTVTVTEGTMSDSVFQVFSGSCATLIPIICSDPNSATAGGLTIGATYYIRIYSYSSNATSAGSFTLCITTPPPPPANDNCVNAIVAPVNSALICTNTVSGTTVNATQSMPGCVGNADDDVWYKFVATSTAHNIAITVGTLSDSVFEVFSGTCGTLNSILCSDPPTGTVTGLTVGTTYYVRIYSYFTGSGETGTFTLCITTPPPPPPPPANDNCVNAVVAPVNPDLSCTNTVSGTTVNASQSMPGCVGNADDDVWYKFVATSTSHLITITTGTLSDSVFEVFSGTCATLNSILCSDPPTGTVSGLIVGNTYFVRVYSYSSTASSQGAFTLCIKTPVPPCTAGTGIGTSNSCVITAAGGLGLNGAAAPDVTCDSGLQCVTLEASYLALGQTTNYNVASIPYAPPYQFSCLANAVSATVDDVWSPVVDLPFNFCFYGNTYNKVLISSNGVISFDMINNSPGGTSTWSFSDNLPSTNLFRNAIFGAYHDINPSIGGTIGWELIQLNTGCRALVASWSNVPMYSCTELNYTGMIVLYENTNIIEVYLKEKNVCAGWNDGNAIIGIQNAAGTQAVVPPNRNGLNPDWTTSNEAWRFTPSGTAVTTVKWFEGNTAIGTVLGTSNTLSVCPETTTNYTARVNYTLCTGGILSTTATTTVTIAGKAKTWNGGTSTNWNVASNWTPSGVPTAINCVTIPTTTRPAEITNAASAASVNITNSGHLTIFSNHSLELQAEFNVSPSGNFIIQNNGSLVQVGNQANTGIMKMSRTTKPMYRFDYSYWNSPVTLNSGFSLANLSPATLSDKYYSWQPSVSAGGPGNWIQQAPTTIMNPTKGYIVRAPQTFSTNPSVKVPYTAVFIGTPNNGNISVPISKGTMVATSQNDKWNLIGNPYPSAVNALKLLDEPANIGLVDRSIYHWTHNSAISTIYDDPFYGDYVYNYSADDYAIWNSMGATAATSGGPVPSGYIAAGSSFFIQSLTNSGNLQFTNAMRVRNNNAEFFKSSNNNYLEPTPSSDFEKHRIWINMLNNSSAFSQIIIGYADGATLDYDNGIDANRLSAGTTALYSTIENHNLAIQGRPLPFDASDIIPLGYVTDLNDEFSIRIQETDPLFDDYEIFLEDKTLNIMHNLKLAPYHFTTTVGRFDNRFSIRFLNNLLDVSEYDANSMLSAYVKDQYLNVRSSESIETVLIFDITGKLVTTLQPVASATENRWRFPFAQGAYLAKFKLANGKEVNRKLIH